MKRKTVTNLKIRAHRIVLQLSAMVVVTYFYGWWALLLAVFIGYCEYEVPHVDKLLNPWYRKWKREQERKQIAKMVSDFITSSNVKDVFMEATEKDIVELLRVKIDDDYCPNCGREYDKTDRRHQMCHHCGHDNYEKQ